ncbi:MAG: hypothetical protein ACOH1T_05680 [Microbacteriaceae bacterium]
MSNLAYARPSRPRRSDDNDQISTRHVEIVTTRAQRRSRPKIVYALATIAGLFAVLLAQLLLSIAVSDGAYEISALRVEQRNLTRVEQSLAEQVELLASPQNLATRAEGLGMVMSTSTPMFLRMADGAVVGSGSGANRSGALLGAAGSLVANSLLVGMPELDPNVETGGVDTSNVPSQVQKPAQPPATATTGTLPSPVTR